jgi:hypothetical protein
MVWKLVVLEAPCVMIQVTPQQFGAKGDGVRDDSSAFREAFEEIGAHGGGALQLPPGIYYLDSIVLSGVDCPLAIIGCAPGVSQLLLHGGIDIEFEQVGIRQPHQITLANFGLSPAGRGATALRVAARHNNMTNEHDVSPLRISGVSVESNHARAWGRGVVLSGVWNAQLRDLFISGSTEGVDPTTGDWSTLSGAGITLEDMCVNATLTNVHTNFWAEGIKAHAGQLNTEGIFCSNCTMVGVKRGVWLKGNPSGGPGPRIHTMNWTGGMIENRAGSVSGGIAAFHLESVWSATIQGCQMITETMDTLETTYGVIAQDCRRTIVNGCEINAYHMPFLSTGESIGHVVSGNAFPNCYTNACFSPGAQGCVAGGNT